VQLSVQFGGPDNGWIGRAVLKKWQTGPETPAEKAMGPGVTPDLKSV
jgi:hypothetical protein